MNQTWPATGRISNAEDFNHGWLRGPELFFLLLCSAQQNESRSSSFSERQPDGTGGLKEPEKGPRGGPASATAGTLAIVLLAVLLSRRRVIPTCLISQLKPNFSLTAKGGNCQGIISDRSSDGPL